jgi:hypothetical protein
MTNNPTSKQTTLTITEALAEIKLIPKKIAKKLDFIREHSLTYNNQPDPLKATGGREKHIKEYKQAITDLIRNYEIIRQKIMEANLKESVTILGETKTIYEWLVWKRETYTTQLNVAKLYQGVEAEIKRLATRPELYKKEGWKEGDLPTFVTVKPNINIEAYRKEVEKWDDIYNKLDGKLSLKNATITITY